MATTEQSGATGPSGAHASPLAAIRARFAAPVIAIAPFSASAGQAAPQPTLPVVSTPAVETAAPGPTPPPGALLFFGAPNARPCAPADAHHWTWEGAHEWFYVADVPLPPHRMVLAPTYKGRCRRCMTGEPRVAEQVFANGTKHLRAECDKCGGFIEHLKRPPKNLDIQWRAVG